MPPPTRPQRTTPVCCPRSIVAPIVNFVDTSRPIVSVIGPQDLGTGSWSYARITQHTQVGVQSAEKTELASRKMLITKTPLAAPTYGGYVNVSRQDINRTSPQILDMVIADLAGQYAIQTEAAAATDLTAAATAGPVIPATPTAANIATAIYAAAGSVFTATQGQGRTVIALSPDQLGIIAPLFPGVNPQNALSTGFSACDLAFGSVGAVSGLQVVMSAGLAADTILVFSTAAVRAFEARYGALQVVEPSRLGRAGRLRRRLRNGCSRGDRCRPGHHGMSTYDDPNREAVGQPPIWTGAEAEPKQAGAAAAGPVRPERPHRRRRPGRTWRSIPTSTTR